MIKFKKKNLLLDLNDSLLNKANNIIIIININIYLETFGLKRLFGKTLFLFIRNNLNNQTNFSIIYNYITIKMKENKLNK